MFRISDIFKPVAEAFEFLQDLKRQSDESRLALARRGEMVVLSSLDPFGSQIVRFDPNSEQGRGIIAQIEAELTQS